MKKLSFIMAVIMIVMTFPMMFMTSASAAGDNPADGYQITQEDKDSGKLCKLGNTYYDTIKAAIDAAEDGATIYVLKDTSNSSYEWWYTLGRDLTVDFLGNKMSTTSASGYCRLAHSSVGGGYDPAGANDPGSITIKNAKIKQNAPICQLNNYTTLVVDNCDVSLVSNDYGIAINQSFTSVKLVNGTHYENNATSYGNNSAGPAFRNNGGVGNTFYVEDSYVYSAGSFICTPSAARGNKGPTTFIAKNSTLETGYQNMFILMATDMTIDLDKCNVNVYTKGRHSAEGDAGALIWQHASTNRTKVSIKDCNINVNDMKSGTYVFAVDSAAAGTVGNEYKIENTNVTANNGGIFSLGGKNVAAEVTFNGGVYTATGGRILRVSTSTDATYNFVDGTFVAYNLKDEPVAAGNGESVGDKGMFYLSNCKALNIYGGSYSLFSDHGLTLCTKSPIILGWANGGVNTNVYGGKFTGGSCFFAKVKNDSNAKYDEAGSVFYGYAEGKNSINLAPDVTKGASVRLDTKSGLRFTSTIDAKAVEYIGSVLAKADTALTFGTVITRASYLKYTGGEFTMAAFDKAGKNYVNVVAKDGIVKDEKGNVTINAALVDIDADNYTKDFVAISYIKYTNANDEEVYLYATNVTLAEYARNMEEVALAALADVKTKAEGAYTNAVSEYYVYNVAARKYELYTGTAYSAYTAEQVKALQSYIVVEE